MGLWWNVIADNVVEKYLQLENDRLCFKMSGKVENTDILKTQWLSWYDRLEKAAKGRIVLKRSQCRPGRHMTVAFLKDSYLKTTPDGNLDIEATIEFLKIAEEVMNSADKS